MTRRFAVGAFDGCVHAVSGRVVCSGRGRNPQDGAGRGVGILSDQPPGRRGRQDPIPGREMQLPVPSPLAMLKGQFNIQKRNG